MDANLECMKAKAEYDRKFLKFKAFYRCILMHLLEPTTFVIDKLATPDELLNAARETYVEEALSVLIDVDEEDLAKVIRDRYEAGKQPSYTAFTVRIGEAIEHRSKTAIHEGDPIPSVILKQNPVKRIIAAYKKARTLDQQMRAEAEAAADQLFDQQQRHSPNDELVHAEESMIDDASPTPSRSTFKSSKHNSASSAASSSRRITPLPGTRTTNTIAVSKATNTKSIVPIFAPHIGPHLIEPTSALPLRVKIKYSAGPEHDREATPACE